MIDTFITYFVVCNIKKEMLHKADNNSKQHKHHFLQNVCKLFKQRIAFYQSRILNFYYEFRCFLGGDIMKLLLLLC